MAIEIKQLLVKTTVGTAVNRGGSAKTDDHDVNDLEAIKYRILAECRDLFYELLNEQKER
jgi:hypothetical protein